MHDGGPGHHASGPPLLLGMPSARSEVVFLSAVRTGFGTFGGALKDLSATDLGVHAAQAAIARAGLPASAVDHVIVGNALQTSADAIYLARHVALRAGCRVETPAVTVNRLCGSGLQAIKANPSKPSVDAMLTLLDKLRVIEATGVLGVDLL